MLNPRVLEQLINEVGKRLGFKVTFGEHRKGPDGIWEIGDNKIVVGVKSSSFYFDPTELNRFIKSQNALCGIAVSSDFADDKVATVKGGYPKIRLITSGELCKLDDYLYSITLKNGKW